MSKTPREYFIALSKVEISIGSAQGATSQPSKPTTIPESRVGGPFLAAGRSASSLFLSLSLSLGRLSYLRNWFVGRASDKPVAGLAASAIGSAIKSRLVRAAFFSPVLSHPSRETSPGEGRDASLTSVPFLFSAPSLPLPPTTAATTTTTTTTTNNGRRDGRGRDKKRRCANPISRKNERVNDDGVKEHGADSR